MNGFVSQEYTMSSHLRCQIPILLIFACLILIAPAAHGCLVATSPPTATVQSMGFSPAGLELLQVRVTGFELIELSAPVGCTLGLSLESQITGPPLYAIQKRGLTTSVAVVDPEGGSTANSFQINPSATSEFMAETIGLGYFAWPIPVAFVPFTVDTTSLGGASLPHGQVELLFDLAVKPPYTAEEVIEDLEVFGYIASDFSVVFNGITYLLWSSAQMVHEIEEVIVK